MEEAVEFFHCSGGAADHFAVDDLFDFSNENENDGVADIYAAACDDSVLTDSCNSSSVSGRTLSFSSENCGFSDGANFSGDLCVPYDDLAELEWVSNFVEESFSTEDLQKLQLISGFKTRPDSSSIVSNPYPIPNINNTSPIFTPDVSVPAKARSKRSRVAGCNWASCGLLIVSPTVNPITPETAVPSHRQPPARQNTARKPSGSRKKESAAAGENNSGRGEGRRCLHCATDKTPQWRTGPMGPKTLCNACGVRYKSGRLVPEYRPASSPTFVFTKHSNSHRKVMELRRQKELMRAQQHILHHHQNNTVFDDSWDGDDYLIHSRVGPDFRQLI